MSIDTILSKYKSVISSGVRSRPYVYYPTSLYSLNQLLGGKGFQGGKIVQLLAENKAGKTTLSADIIANAQRMGKRCVFVDYERTWDSDYMAQLGVDNESLIKITAPYMDEAAELVEALIETGEIGVVVIDSIPAAMHSSEKEKNMTDSERMAGTAAEWTRHLKRIVPLADDTDTLVVLINQYRADLRPMTRTDKKPWGARQIQYSSSYIIDMTRIKNEDGKATVQIMITKNKVDPTEGHKTEVILQHGLGFRADIDLINAAIAQGIITQKGAWYTFGDDKAAGKDNAAAMFDLEAIRKALTNNVSV